MTAHNPSGQSYSEPKPFVDTWLGRAVAAATVVGTAATIIGTIIAAGWAYKRYVDEDAPALLLRPKMQGELSWYRRAGSVDECIAVFKITLENIGKRPIELTAASVRVWPLDIRPETDIDYIDPVDRTNGIDPSRKADLMPPEDPSQKKAFLRTYYPPGVADELGMMFRLKRDQGKIVVFIAEGKYQVEGTKKKDDWYWHAWDEVCGLERLPEAAKDSSLREKANGHPLATPPPTE